MKMVIWSSLNISTLNGASVAEMAANTAHTHTKRYRNLNELPSLLAGKPEIKNRKAEQETDGNRKASK
jgi:hypothetical protein